MGLILHSHLVPIAIIIATGLLASREILSGDGIPAGWDALGAVYPIAYFAKNGAPLSLWEDSSLGYTTPLTLYNFWSMFSFIFGFVLASKLLFLFTIFGLSFAGYLSGLRISGSKFGGLFASLLITYNGWTISNMASGHFLHVLSLGLMVILVTKLLHFEGDARFIWIIAVLIASFVILRVEPLAYALVAIFAISIIYLLFSLLKGDFRTFFMQYLSRIIIAFIIGLCLCSFVWIPLLVTGSIHTTIRLSPYLVATNTIDLLASVGGQGLIYSYVYWNYGISFNTHPYLSVANYYMLFLIMPIICIAYAFFRHNRMSITLLFLLLLGIVLSQGPRFPFTALYLFLSRNIPMFDRLLEPNRWLILTWSSYALLSAKLVADLTRVRNLLRRRHLLIFKRPYCLVINFFYKLGKILLPILILISAILPAETIFTKGYKIWSPEWHEVAPYLWLTNKTEDVRVVSVPYGYVYQFTKGGWLQADLSAVSPIFSGKPNLSPPSGSHLLDNDLGDFLQHLEWIIQDSRCIIFPKIAGSLNVKYFVLNDYPPSQPDHPIYHDTYHLNFAQQEYFTRQMGLTEIFEINSTNSIIKVGQSWETVLTFNGIKPQFTYVNTTGHTSVFLNEYWLPRIYATRYLAYIVGGYESFEKLAQLEDFQFNDYVLHFYNSDLKNKDTVINNIKKSDFVVFCNSEVKDIYIPLAGHDLIADLTSIPDNWDLTPIYTRKGYFTLNRKSLYSDSENATLCMSFYIPYNAASNISIWIRTLQNPFPSKIAVYVDGKYIDSLIPYNLVDGFTWIKTRSFSIRPGQHVLMLRNEKFLSNSVYIDSLIVAEDQIVNKVSHEIQSLLESKKVVYLFDPKNIAHYSYLLPLPNEDAIMIDHDSWMNPNHPEETLIKDKTLIEDRIRNITTFILEGPRAYYPILWNSLDRPITIDSLTYLTFYFKGMATGIPLNVYLLINGARPPSGSWIAITFVDAWTDWRKIVIPVASMLNGERGTATPSMQNITTSKDQLVTDIVIDSPIIDLKVEWSFSDFFIHNVSSIPKVWCGVTSSHMYAITSFQCRTFNSNIFKEKTNIGEALTIKIYRISPYKYELTIQNSFPVFLILTNTFDTNWVAYMDGQELHHFRANAVLNGYKLEKVGVHHVTIFYRGQVILEFSFLISMGTFLGMILIICYERRKKAIYDQHKKILKIFLR